jgi:hypothetical protein
MKRLAIIIIISLVFISQIKAQHKSYFPLGKSNDNTKIDTVFGKWYSQELADMKEPVLFKNKIKDEVYRFTWLRSFNYPIVIRIVKHNNVYSIIWKEGNDDHKHPKLIIDKQKTIAIATWNDFLNKLKQINFWEMQTTEQDNGMDGAQWILEGKIINKYHVVDRWTPSASTAYYKCCDFLISLTDIKIAPRRKY